MQATNFECRYRFWIIALIYCLGFSAYRYDQQQTARWRHAGSGGIPWLAGSLGGGGAVGVGGGGAVGVGGGGAAHLGRGIHGQSGGAR